MSDVPPTPPITQYEGAYDTVTQWWDGFFSPLIVYPDGDIAIGETLITPQFDPASNTMSFDWTNIVQPSGSTTAKGQLTFSANGAAGSIVPRPQDGPVPWSAVLKTRLDPATLTNAVPVAQLFDVGDTFLLSAFDGKYVTISNGQLVATTSDQSAATLFTVTSQLPDLSLTFSTSAGNVYAEGSKVWVAVGGQGSPLHLSASLAGSALIAVGPSVYFYEGADGVVGITDELQLTAAMEFELRVTPVPIEELARRYGIDLSAEVTDCQLAIANVIWQATGGAFLALGLGPFLMSSDKVAVGLFGLLRQSPKVWAAVEGMIATITADPDSIATCATAVAAFLGALWLAGEGLFWKVIKFILWQLGWWALFKVVAHIIATVIVPEAEVALLFASIVTWGLATLAAAANAVLKCKSTELDDAPAVGAY